MGYGAYSSSSRATRATTLGYDTRPAREIFSRNFNSEMNPNGVILRESRDSDDHPLSLPIVIGLDVTGSMGHVPHYLVKEGLPHVIQSIIDGGIASPQVLFMGIGDHECDRAPLQIGQFESSDELMDQWLTKLWIEGGGGGNRGESYLLAWYFASRFTESDHMDQRGQKGVLFTIGDEPLLTSLPVEAQRSIFGTTGQYEPETAERLLAAAQEKYEVFHLHVMHGHRRNIPSDWEKLLGPNLIPVQDQNQVATTMIEKVIEVANDQGSTSSPSPSDTRFDNIEI